MENDCSDYSIFKIKKEKIISILDKLNKFDEDMSVSVVPPFCGTMFRFFVTSKIKKHTNTVVVFLDCHKSLKTSELYWEVYPSSARHYDESCGIVRFDDVNGLLELIRKASH